MTESERRTRFPRMSLHLVWLPVILAASCLAAALAGDDVRAWLRYDRSAIEAGEVWRLLLGHFVHLGWSHLWLNIAGLGLVWLLVGSAFSQRVWAGAFLILSVSISGALWFFEPGVSWYVGLSGVLHGLLVVGALGMVKKHREVLLLLSLVMFKLVWEQQVGPMPGTTELSGGPVIVDAHLYGAVSGVIAFGLLAGWRGRRR